MGLTLVNVHRLRNLQVDRLKPGPGINLIHGDNGSGKTSFLEAIHLLGLARSFRSVKSQPLIHYNDDTCVIYGELFIEPFEQKLSILRERSGNLTMRINGECARSAAELAELLPIQLINPDSFELLDGSPKVRRQFMDWGVFHVEHRFLGAWQRYQRALQQRNAAIKTGVLSDANLIAWEQAMHDNGQAIDEYRDTYINAFYPVFEKVLGRLIDLPELAISYHRGWDKERQLLDVLSESRKRDGQLGHTQHGPQRSDIRIKYHGQPADEVLSRGQQKMVASAMRIAQGFLLNQQQVKQGRCVFLVDDLPAELDAAHRHALCELLIELKCQTFITAIEPNAFEKDLISDSEVKMFHVKQGRLTETTECL